MNTEKTDNILLSDEKIHDLLHECVNRVEKVKQRGRGQGGILRILLQEGNLPQKTIQEKLSVKAGTMSEIITKLENKGYLIREKHPVDKRMVLLSLTPEGEKEAKRPREKYSNALNFSRLDESEKEELIRILSKMLSD